MNFNLLYLDTRVLILFNLYVEVIRICVASFNESILSMAHQLKLGHRFTLIFIEQFPLTLLFLLTTGSTSLFALHLERGYSDNSAIFLLQ